MSNLYCPYCEHDCGDYVDDCHEQDTEYEYQCPECNKNFIFTIEYEPNYSSSKADCLNGGEHDFKPIIGYPTEYFKNKVRCSMCGKEKIIDELSSTQETAQ